MDSGRGRCCARPNRPEQGRGILRKRLRRRGWGPLGLALLFFSTLGLTLGAGWLLYQHEAAPAAALPPPTTAPAPEPTPVYTVDLKTLYSPHAILIEADTGAVLAANGETEPIYPASMTKIMTVLLALEALPDLDAVLTVPEEIFPELWAANASLAGFQPGEQAAVRDLVYGALLPSGAECSLTLALAAVGSEADFVKRMNDKAAALGMADTHFQNPTGLHDPAHISTVADIAVLLRAALQNAEFRAAFTAHSHAVPPSEAHPEGFTVRSTLFRDMDGPQVTGGEILGGKTGYTDEAGLCLASLARLGDKEYILVTAGAPGDSQSERWHILDARNVYSQLGAQMAGQD